MMKAPIFARVRPKSIKLTEKYNFSIEIDSINDNVECSEEAPEGCLEIHIPYDGVEFVNQQTFKDVKRQAPKRLQDEQAEIRIGYLGFSHYECTDILDNLKVNSTDVLPLDIPIKSKKLADQQNGGNHFACRFRHEYTPQWPEMVPLYLTINVLEENTEGINETLLDLLAELTPEESETWSVGLVQQKSRYENEIAEKIESLLKKHTHFKPLLRFYFNIRLDLPRHFCPDIDDEFDVIDDSDDDSGDTEDQSAQGEDRNNEADSDKTTNQDNEELPEIKRLSIQWPMAISPRDATLRAKGIPKERLYDPKKGIIEWHSIEFNAPSGVAPGTDLYHYKAPTVSLFVYQPGELYRREHLEGEIEITLPRTLSGLQISYFNAMGQKVSDTVEYRTTLTTKFKLFLRAGFEQKKYLLAQQLEFEGVILSEIRLDDIQRVLEDLGFILDPKDTKTKEVTEIAKNKFYFLNRIKGDLPEQIRLWMLVQGKSTQTTRERKIPGEHTFKTILETGHMTINMYGSIRGDRTHLVELMNSIHTRLKDQFYHVSTID